MALLAGLVLTGVRPAAAEAAPPTATRPPNIDALFARGTRLAWHWAGSAVCAPSRGVLMTGKHPGHAVVRSNREVKPGIRCVR